MRAGAPALWFALLGACASGTRNVPVGAIDPPPANAPASPEASRAGESEHEPEATLEDFEEAPDDGADDGHEPSAPGSESLPHPLDAWSDDRIKETVAASLGELGPMSLGSPSAGLLLNGVQAVKNELYDPVSPSAAWATEETLGYLQSALRKVQAEIAGTPPLPLGDISAEKGGPLAPHISHQAGRDVDIAYFYRGDARWYRRGNAQNLDVARSWAFVRALVTETDVELILIDHAIQALLREHALAIGEDAAWVDGIFRGGNGQRPLVRHARGHATHVHVRFYNPIAQETARRAYASLVAHGVVPPVQSFLQHRAKRGDTIGKLAKRYGTTIVAIKRANRLKKSLIKERRTYLIPLARPRPSPPSRRLTFPARRVPPDRTSAGPLDRG